MGVCRVRLGVSGVSRVCRGCVGRVCRGCVACRVCQGSVGGACRVCRGRGSGVSRVCQGCVGGVRMEAVCPGARDSPPLPSAPVSLRGCVCPRRGFVRLSSFSACARPRGLPLFSASDLRVPRESRRRLLGTASSFPRGLKETQDRRATQRHARHTRVCFSPCAPHVAFIRLGLLPLFPRGVKHTRASAPHRSTRNAKFPNFTPPQKTPPRPSGTQHTARNGCRAST